MPTIIAAFTDGWGRVLRAPVILLGSFVVTLLMALPAARAVESGIAGSLGSSLDAETMAEGVNGEWWERFEESARGLDSTFTPSVIGFGAVVDNLSRVVDNGALPSPVVGVVAASLAVWLFLVGGILVPTGIVLLLLLLPYIDRNPATEARNRKVAVIVFSGLLIAAIVLTVIGTLFRGPGWTFVAPWTHLYLEL